MWKQLLEKWRRARDADAVLMAVGSHEVPTSLEHAWARHTADCIGSAAGDFSRAGLECSRDVIVGIVAQALADYRAHVLKVGA